MTDVKKSGPGQGREKGKSNLKTVVRRGERGEFIEIIDETGLKPITVMTNNMIFWYQSAETMTNEIMELDFATLDNTEKVKLLKKIDKMIEFREKSQAAAVDLAPYIHPKLSSMTMNIKKTNIEVKVLETMTPQEAAEAYERSFES